MLGAVFKNECIVRWTGRQFNICCTAALTCFIQSVLFCAERVAGE